jgi:hypothetical protein
VRVDDFVERYPRLFHMTSASAWRTIERHGLRSVTAILDLMYIDPDRRGRIEAERRPDTVHLSDSGIGEFEIRDQKPLHVGKLASCLTDMTVTQWLQLLNRKVFFWPTEQRVDELLGAGEYKDREHLILVVRTSSLVAIHGPEITLAPINTGAVLYAPAPRGSGTLVGIAEYAYAESRRRRGSRRAIAEVAVDYAVPDILNHIIRVERRQHGRPAQVLAGP